MLATRVRTASLAWAIRMSAGSVVGLLSSVSYMLPESSISRRKVIPVTAPAFGVKAEIRWIC